jgi:hypothetical protein
VNLVIGDIDLTKKVPKPQVFLCKPNRTTIGKLTFAYNINLTVNLGKVNELTFDLPYQVDIHHNFQRDTNIDNVRVQYLIKLVYNGMTDWFIVDKISEAMDSNGDKKSIHAFSLAYQLINKRIRNYQADSQTATQQLTTALANTTWSVGTVDSSFDTMYRGMDISSNTILEVVYQIADTFSALVQFNSDSKTIDLLVPDNFGQDKGLNFKYGKYLKQLGNDIDTSNMITEIKAYGKDDLTIGAVNPTGSDGIQNLGFFLYPFQRDSNKNVISSSNYMSDDLCNAILDYEDLVNSYTDQYKSLLVQLTNAETTLTAKQTDLTNLINQLAIINDNLDLQKSQKTLTIYNFTYTGSSVTKTTTLDSTNDYVVMMNASSVSNLTVKLDGTTKTLSANTWTVLGKLSGKTSTSVALSGSNSNSTVSIYVLQISSDEYSASGNDTDLFNKYNDKYEQSLIDAKQKEVDSAQADVDGVQSQINTIVDTLSIEKNFTPEQIEERDAFIITYEWSDSNYIDAQSLYDEAVKQLQQLQSPPIAITIDIVNFLEVVESQREWDKLVLGDKVRISYDMFNLDVKAQITNIQYDFENANIKLTIANVKEIKDDKKKFLDNLYSGVSASKSVDMSKYKWDQGVTANTDFQNFLSNAMDATKQQIIAGVNETVTIDRRGIKITDATNPNNIVVAQAGVIALSQDGGETWSTAIDPTGIYAPLLIGTIFIGQDLQMQNNSGTMTFDDNGLTLTSTDNTKRVLINQTDGIKVQTSSDNGTTWKDQFYVNSSGQLIANGLGIYSSDGSTMLIDGTSKTIDFSKFNVIAGQLSASNIDVSSATNLNSNPNTDPKIGGYSGGQFVTDNTSPSGSNNAYMQSGRDVHYGSSFDVSPGELFYVGGWAKLVSGSNDFNFGVDFLDADGSTHHWIVGATATHTVSGWQYVEGTVTAPTTASSGTVWFQIPVFSNYGSWNFTKTFVRRSGMITFDKAKGGQLSLGGANNGNGVLTLYNSNGDTIAQFDSDQGGFDTLSVTNLISQSVVSQNLIDQNYSVSSGGLQSLLQSIPPFNEGYITITLTSDTTETINIRGFSGGGTIEINLNGHKINGDVNINGNTNTIYIRNGTVNGTGKNTSTIDCTTSSFITFDSLTVLANNDTHNIRGWNGVFMSVTNTECHGATGDIIVSEIASTIRVDTCKGDGAGYGAKAYAGGIILAYGSVPNGTAGLVNASHGSYAVSDGITSDAGTAPVTPTAAPTTKTWTSTSANDYSNSGYWDNSNQAKQGNYGYGRRTGLFFFSSDLSSSLSGKNITNMQVYLYRPSTGGSSGDVTINIHTHNYSSTPSGAPTVDTANTVTLSLPWGGSGWVTLPSSMYSQFSNGTAKGIGLYVASDSSSNYAVFNGTNCKVKATYS